MRLAFCLFNYFPFGGLQRDFLRIAKLCVARGHQVDVYTMRWDGDLEPGLTVHRIPVRGWQHHTRRKQFVRQVQPYLQQGHYDLVVGFNKMPGLDVYYAADTCYQAKARQQRGWWYRLMPRYRQAVAFEKAVFSPASHAEILMISAQQQAEFTRYYQTPAERFHLLPPGIDRDRLAPANAADIREAVRYEYGLPEQAFLLLMVGSGFRTKGLDRLLLAYAALPEPLKQASQVMVIGKNYPSAYQRQAKRLGIDKQVTFLGGRNDVPRFLLAADALLHPAYNENTGTVLLEALAAGLPVITTDVCGYAHYVKEAQAGMVLSSPFQQADLNQALINVLSSSERTQWKANALAFAKQADIYSLPEKAVSLLEDFHQK